jgi:hypothetical protein
MVQEILKNIDEKVNEQILKIEEEKEKAILALKKKYSQMQKQQKEKNILVFKNKIESEIKDFSQKKELELEFAVLEKKNKIIKDLYGEAGKSIKEENLKKFILSYLPKSIEGKIEAGKKTAKIIKEATGRDADGYLEEEGFVIVGENADFDFRISEILSQSEQELKPELTKLLFE